MFLSLSLACSLYSLLPQFVIFICNWIFDPVANDPISLKFLYILDDGSAIQDALAEITNQRSVPNIFINKNHIGGNSDLQARSAELPQLLKEAGAL